MISTVVLAAVTVVLAIVLVGSAGGEADDPSTGSAAASAELGCRLLSELPDDGYGDDAGLADAHRLTTIGSLGYLAGEQDDAYNDLAEKLGALMSAAASASLAEPGFPETLEAARDACGDHGF